MVAWSTISRALASKSLFNAKVAGRLAVNQKCKDLAVQVRHGGHGPESFHIHPSNWQWDKFKDIVHFYLMVGVIPITAVITYINVFIGPAQLAPIPEGYEPKHWEYHRHPITRFLSQYVVRNPQQEYEKYCHALYEETEKMRLRKVEKEVRRLMAERLDYQAWFYRPAMVKYARQSKKFFDEARFNIGEA